jgi:hypothetical protein
MIINMANKKVKKQDHEKLTDSNIAHVIELLEGSPPISKKEACDILHISYNTTRLNKIIDEWKTNKEYRDKRKAERRGKPATDSEIQTIASGYLEGDSITDIAKQVYRTPAFVKALIERIGVPTRGVGDEKYKPGYLPDACLSDSFSAGEIAWSATYHAPCEIIKALTDPKYQDKYAGNCYQIWVKEKSVDANTGFGLAGGGFNAFVPAYELGKLSHLKEYGVKIENL